MTKVSMIVLFKRINQKYVIPAIEKRKIVVFNYLQSVNETAAHEYAYDLNHNKGILSLVQPGYKYSPKPAKKIYLSDLPDYNQIEIKKHLYLLKDLEQVSGKIKTYLSFLNNKSNTAVDIAYALPPHINQLVPMDTPDTYLDDDLRDPVAYTLLNELQIKLLLLS
tara:strand:+ start:1470 stop:1964 length:495 start_codon:yes stop_codon:yes gene_type:complete